METKKKRDSWDVEETKYFLELVRGRKVMKNLDGKRFRAEEIFSHLQSPMVERGYLKTSKQMQMRFKTLRMQYNQYKKSLGKSGAGNCRNRFPFFDLMEKLLGDRPMASQEGIDSTEWNNIEEGDVLLDKNMYDDQPDERDGAIPGCSKDPESLLSSQEESNDIVMIPENENSPCSSRTSGTPESSTTQTRNQEGKVVKKKRGQSFQNVIYNYANIAKENAKELQNEVLQTQQKFLNNIMKEQREFETQLLQQMLDGHKKILSDVTNQLLNGLKTISQSPPSVLQVASPISPSDSCFGSVSPSSLLSVQNSTTPPVRFGKNVVESRPVRVILRPLSTQSSPVEGNYTTFSPPPPSSFRSIRACSPASFPNFQQSNAVRCPMDSSSFSNIHHINSQSTVVLKPLLSQATQDKPSHNPDSEHPRD